jgi:hypothetical protein
MDKGKPSTARESMRPIFLHQCPADGSSRRIFLAEFLTVFYNGVNQNYESSAPKWKKL